MKDYFKILFVLFFPVLSMHAVQENPTEKFKDSIQIEVAKLSDSLKAQKYYNASFHALQRLNDLKLSRLYADSSMYYAKVSGFKDSEAKSHFQFGLLERIDGNYEKALDHLNTNIQYFKNDSTLISYSLFQVGVIYKALGDYDNSLKTYLTILEIFEKKKDSFAIASALNSIGNIYGEMEKPDEAIKNFTNALRIFEAKNSERDIANAYENIGKMYVLKGDDLTAINSIQKALTIARSTNEDYQIAKALHALGKTYLNSNLDNAFKNLNESSKLFERKNYQRELIPVYRDIGHYYKEKKNYNMAIENYNKSLKLAKEFNEKPYIKDASKGLYETHKILNNYDDAFKYQSEYIAIKDSLFNSENLKAVNLLQNQFEAKNKDNKIIVQKLQLEQQNNQLQQKQAQTNYALGTAIFSLITMIGLWMYYKQRQKRKNQELLVLRNEAQINSLESLIEGEEKERFRIAKELHDGINGDLSAIKHKLNSLIELNNKTIEEAVVMIDKSCEQVRAISHNLVPPALENFDLQTAASDYCTNMNNIHSPKITFDYLGDDVVLPKIIEINIFRIIQELVTNSIKHANANKIDVQLSIRGNDIQLAVEDDGKGFDVSNLETEGIGISNVKNRVSFLNGEMDIASNNEGTFVNVFMDKSRFNDH